MRVSCCNLWSSPIRFTYIVFILKELFIACLYIHNHLTSIRFSSGVRVERNTRCILELHLAIVCFTLFDLYIDALSSTQNICLIRKSYFLSTRLTKSKNCFPVVFLLQLCAYVRVFVCHKHQTRLAVHLFFGP